MAYCIRFVFDDERRPTLADLDAGIRSLDDAYRIAAVGGEGPGAAEIHHGDGLIGLARLQSFEDPGAVGEIQARIDELEELEEEDAELDTADVSARLWNATGMLTVEVQWEGGDHAESLRKLNLLWGMLLGSYSGLLHADLEGYYDADGLLLDLG